MSELKPEELATLPLDRCPAQFRRPEAAAYLRKSIRCIDRMLARGELRHKKVGGTILIHRDEIRRLIEG